MRNPDPLGYYAALNLSPDASTIEIRLSYQFLKQAYQQERKQLDIGKIRSAYETLMNPSTRRLYDQGNLRSNVARPALKISLSRPDARQRVLLGILVVSCIVLAVLVGPVMTAGLRSFDAGDEVYWMESGERLGVVLGFQERHHFPSGAVAPAYEIRPETGPEPVWYPAHDLKRHARAR